MKSSLVLAIMEVQEADVANLSWVLWHIAQDSVDHHIDNNMFTYNFVNITPTFQTVIHCLHVAEAAKTREIQNDISPRIWSNVATLHFMYILPFGWRH